MNIGFIGLGKLGLPCALAMESRGHNVIGHDIDNTVTDILNTRTIPYHEIDAEKYLQHSNIKNVNTSEVIRHSEIIFVTIQTPHEIEYEGITRLPKSRVDFDYQYLIKGMKHLSDIIDKEQKEVIVVIISTVLPGTVQQYIKPILNPFIKLCYNPYFIAMGTTIPDFFNPEFVLLGVDDEEAAETVTKFYQTIHDKPVYKTTINNAELIKVAYNTFIGMKIVFINTMMEICHKNDCDVDAITNALILANDRLISSKYMRGGMGDGGGCHPRDNIALSWLTRKLNLSHDFFEDIMKAREDQTEWLANLILEQYEKTGLSITILGKAFKPKTNLTVGSPSILLKNILEENGDVTITMADPYTDNSMPVLDKRIYFIGTKHEDFKNYKFPAGSVVIDPWRYIPKQEGVQLISIGKAPTSQTVS